MRISLVVSISFIVVLAIIGTFVTNPSSDHTFINTLDSEISHDELLGPSNNKQKPLNSSEHEGFKRSEQQALMALPSSLRGTEINGGFQVDQDGHLIFSSENRDFFEYFLSSMGEETLEQILDRLTLLIQQRLDSPAQEEALALLNNYIEMKRALSDLEQQIGSGLNQYGSSALDAHRARLQMVSDLRRQYLGDDAAQAFYGETEDFDHYMLDRMALTANNELSGQEKERALVDLMEQAPESVKPRLSDEYKMQRLRVDVSDLKAQGASAQEIYDARALVLGEDAAGRLLKVEEAQAEWNGRYAQYTEQRQAIESSNMDTVEQQDAVRALQQDLFSDNEVRRVQALDRISTK